MQDINHITREMDQDHTQLHPKDEISIKLWLDVLNKDGANTFLKDKLDPLPLGSRLAEDLFIVVLQTQFQSDMFQQLGGWIVSIDATYNTTCYSVQLVTIMVRDKWGHGKQINLLSVSDQGLIFIGQEYRLPGCCHPIFNMKRFHIMSIWSSPGIQKSGQPM